MEFAINRIAQMRSLFHSIKNNFYLIRINSRPRIPRRIINEPYVWACRPLILLYNNILFRLRFQNDDVRIKYALCAIDINNLASIDRNNLMSAQDSSRSCPYELKHRSHVCHHIRFIIQVIKSPRLLINLRAIHFGDWYRVACAVFTCCCHLSWK